MKRKFSKLLTQRQFWGIVFLFFILTLLHYSTPQVRALFPPVDIFLNRHAVERIIFILPVVAATLTFGQTGRVIASIAAVIIMLPRAIWLSPYPVDALIETIATALVTYLVALGVYVQVREKTLGQVTLSQVIQAQEDERKRIARELHDETIQILIVILRRIEVLISQSQQLPKEARQDLRELQSMIKKTLNGLRNFIQALRPPTLNHLGLIAALRSFIDEITEHNEIDILMRVNGKRASLPPNVEMALFRITQEALNNILRHARASKVTLDMTYSKNQVQIQIEDNGAGFKPPKRLEALAAQGQLGLMGVQERTRALSGTLQILSSPGCGTKIIVEVPIP